MKYFSFFLFFLVSCIAPTLFAVEFPDTTWISIGPNGGQMMGLVQDANTPTTFYAVVDTGFVYKSTNAGENWQPSQKMGGNRYFEEFEVSPANSSHLYAQSLIVTGWIRTNLRSTDGGTTWSVIAYLPTIFHPTNPDTVFAIESDTLKISTDGGVTWATQSRFPAYPAYSDNIAFLVNTNPSIMISRDVSDTVRRSTDMGKTWTKIARLDGGYLTAKLISQRSISSKHIYAINSLSSGGYEILISRNEGATWSVLATNPQGTTVSAKGLFLPPSDSITIWITLQNTTTGATQLVKSTDQGATWIQIPKSLRSYASPTGFFDHLNKDVMILREDYHISKTTDGGMTWAIKTNGIVAQVGDNITAHPNASAFLFYVSYSPYLYRLVPEGEWSMQFFTDQIATVLAAPSDSSTFYLIPDKMDTILVSSNAAQGWVKIGTGFTNQYVTGTTFEGLPNISVDPSNANILFFNAGSGKGIYKTSSGGSAWTKINDTVTAGITVSPSNSSIVYGMVPLPTSGVSTMYPRKSTDGGTTWTRQTNGFPPVPAKYNDQIFLASSMVVNPNDPHTVQVGGILRKSGSYDSIRVYRTTDGGSTWTVLRNGLPGKFQSEGKVLNKVVIASNPFNSQEYALVIPEAGIFRSTDGGDNWFKLPNPTDRVPLTVAIGRSQGAEVIIVGVYAGSFYVYKLRNAPVGVEHEVGLPPATYTLEQNYPNPFNPSTNIQYSLPQDGFVTLKVFDVLGREVAILINEIKQRGTYTTQWHAADFPSGVYFLRLTAGSSTQVRKMLLMK